MQTQVHANTVEVSQETALESLTTAVVRLAAQRNQLRDHRQRAERSSLVSQALQAYRLCASHQTKPGEAA